MSSLSRNQAYVYIQDQLDALAQKYRAQLIARGLMLFIAFAIAASFVAAVSAHVLSVAFTGGGKWVMAVLVAWAGWMLASLFHWVIPPR
jgi:hypothetical protein